MKNCKIVAVSSDKVSFNNGMHLSYYHGRDCCEHHFLDFSNLEVKDFEGLEFDLSGSDFFEKVEDYGIRLVPTNGHPISIPGYGYNNGYYSSELSLVLHSDDDFDPQVHYCSFKDKAFKTFDISSCQSIDWQ